MYVFDMREYHHHEKCRICEKLENKINENIIIKYK